MSAALADPELDAIGSELVVEDRASGARATVAALDLHNAPADRWAAYAAALAELGARCGPVDEAALDGLLDGGVGGPRAIVGLWEAFRTGYDTALRLVEAAGLTAWLFVPTGFVDCPVDRQEAYARMHGIDLAGARPARVAMSWAELADAVARGHVVASHTASHAERGDLRDAAAVRRELAEPRARLEDRLGVAVRTVAWQWGAPADPWLTEALLATGHRFAVTAHGVLRLAAP